MNIREKICKLKQEKDVLILAHYYADKEVQELADFAGDSYALARKAVETTQKNILFAGVSFMGESAKLLNPDRHVYMLDPTAGCPMADMVTAEQVKEARARYPKAAVVCYVNSSAEVKAESDVCVTSSNAVRVVKQLEQKQIFFIPDQHLAHFTAELLPEKEFIYHTGYCPTHQQIDKKSLQAVKERHPKALTLTHPECAEEVLDLSDYTGSTAEIIRFAKESEAEEFIIATETGVFYQLEKDNPEKKFYPVTDCQVCPDMKKNTLSRLLHVLEQIGEEDLPEIELDQRIMQQAKRPLTRMLELAR